MFPIAKNWYNLLKDTFESDEYKRLSEFLDGEYAHKTIYPAPQNVFNALNIVKYNDVKVVIIGQDPYHEPHQAHGLCFSVEQGVDFPPSLRNVFKELHDDLGCYVPNNGNLTKWAKQGVLLLNSVLTVEKGKANAHKGKGWEIVTSKIISLLNDRADPVVFLLWGGSARAIGKAVTNKHHFKLECAHPSPMSANQGGWWGNKHFSKTNKILLSLGKTPIDWQIENI